jgi:predicted neuraminidase
VYEHAFTDERPFAGCHASTLLELENGETLLSYFAGSREGAGDVGIWTSRRAGDGWDAPVCVAAEAGVPHWNPVLYHGSDGRIVLYYKRGDHPTSWETWYCESSDDGRTWSAGAPLVLGDVGGRGPVKNKCIRRHDGVVLAPASIEAGEVRDGKRRLLACDAFVDISADDGRTWRASAFAPLDHARFEGPGVIQPTLWESKDDSIHMLLRSTCGRVCRSDSTDGGETWGAVYETKLPNNWSGIDCVKRPDGSLVLVYNPVGGRRGERTPLVASISTDNGVSWGETVTLEEEPGEYSYPAVVAAPWGVSTTYTWRRERIAYCRLEMD